MLPRCCYADDAKEALPLCCCRHAAAVDADDFSLPIHAMLPFDIFRRRCHFLPPRLRCCLMLIFADAPMFDAISPLRAAIDDMLPFAAAAHFAATPRR